MRYLLPLLLSASLLAGCSGGGSQQRPVLPDMPGPAASILANQRSLVFAFPALGQQGVAPASPVVLRFSHPLAVPANTDPATLFSIRPNGSSGSVALTATLVDGGVGVILQPNAPLDPATEYEVAGDQIPLTTGLVSLHPDGHPPLTFKTRPATEGPGAQQRLSDTFQVSGILPEPSSFLIGGKPFGLVDFSTIRLQMSQPIDPTTAIYGNTVRLTTGDQLVDARLLVKDHQLTLDPVNDMDPAKTYVLSLGTGLRSTLGKALVPGDYASFQFVPQDSGMASGKASHLAITVPDSGTSLLLGTPVNQVPVASPLLGQGINAPRPQASGTLFADLALPANFSQYNPVVVPLRVPRGNVLGTNSLVVKLDGQVPAGLETGPLTISMVSDANGLLLPNHYSQSTLAPALVTLQMDVSVAAPSMTDNGRTSNGAFTQNLMHVQVAGIATVDTVNQRLQIEAMGVLDLKVLGVDNAVGILALKLTSDLSKAPPSMPKDTVAPLIQSSTADTIYGLDGGEYLRPGDPLVVNFNEAMDVLSLSAPGALQLTADGISEPFDWRLDGSSLVVTPRRPFQHGVTYVLTIGDKVADLAGNPTGHIAVLGLQIPGLSASKIRPPVVLSTYPGFPCPIASGTRNVSAGIQGRCAGGAATDDLLPLPLMEPLRSIDAVMSQSLQPGSVRLGTSCGDAASFRVERIDSSGNCQAAVPGRLQVRPRDLHFTPDQPWIAGQYYRYVLGSNNDLTSATANCSGSQSICGSNGLPLQTQLLAQTLADARNPQRGGPPMEIWFKGGASLGGSNIGLRVLPIQDVNTNFRLDATERRAQSLDSPGVLCRTGQGTDTPATSGRCLATNGALLQPDRTNGPSFTGAATYFAVGCKAGLGAEDESASAGRDCQGNQFLLISASLAARLGGSIDDAGQKAIPVFINPGMVVTSGAQIYVDLGVTPDASPLSQALFSALGAIPVLGPLVNTVVSTGVGLVDGLLPISASDATNTDLPEGQIYTGPLVLRMRHPAGNGPIVGTIKSVGGKLILETQLDLYTDIPELNAMATILGLPAIPIDHKVRSNTDLSADRISTAHGSGSIRVSGEVRFLPDGRLTVQLSNKDPVRVTADLSALGGLLAGSLKVRVPAGRFIIDASLAPLKP